MRFIILALLMASCGSEEHYPSTNLTGEPIGGAPSVYGLCNTEGAKMPCTIILSTHGGVAACASGFMTCEKSVWSECRAN